SWIHSSSRLHRDALVRQTPTEEASDGLLKTDVPVLVPENSQAALDTAMFADAVTDQDLAYSACGDTATPGEAGDWNTADTAASCAVPTEASGIRSTSNQGSGT
ncbi:hypothetical protein LTR60_007898, partial [Cryomyces antarcticus]